MVYRYSQFRYTVKLFFHRAARSKREIFVRGFEIRRAYVWQEAKALLAISRKQNLRHLTPHFPRRPAGNKKKKPLSDFSSAVPSNLASRFSFLQLRFLHPYISVTFLAVRQRRWRKKLLRIEQNAISVFPVLVKLPCYEDKDADAQ